MQDEYCEEIDYEVCGLGSCRAGLRVAPRQER